MIIRTGLCFMFALYAVHAAAGDRVARITLSLDPVAGDMSVEVANPGGPYRFRKYTVGPFTQEQAEGDVLISESGSFVPPQFWWSVPKITPGAYHLTIAVPSGQIAIAAATMVAERTTVDGYRAVFEGRFEDGLPTIFAGPYDVTELNWNEVRMRTYFHLGAESLARPYIAQAAEYIDGYAAEIGAYPYSGFSVVSATLPVGLGFPGVAYVSRDILRMPFMRTRALAHEVLHNWWGNGVMPDFERGNWAEGLTTYMADYRLAELTGPEAAREMRFGWLREFNAVPAARDVPVRAFIARDHGASQAIGYGKVAMIFHMLRQEIGDDAFGSLWRRIWRQYEGEVATWDDIARVASTVAAQDLKGSFAQWTKRKGAADFRIEEARAERHGDGWRVTFVVGQSPPFYRLTVPVVIETKGGRRDVVLPIESEVARATFEVDQQPTAIAIDPDFHLFRRLADAEAPAILRDVMIDDRTGLVTVDARDDVHAEAEILASAMLRRDAPEEAFDGGPAVVIGLTPAIDAALAAAGLPPIPEALAGRGSARAWATRRDDGTPLLIVAADSLAALSALVRPLPHYGSRSYVVFDGAKAIDKGLWPAQTNHALRRAFD